MVLDQFCWCRKTVCEGSCLHKNTLYNVYSVHQYIGEGGCSVHRGDTMRTSGRYHEYIGGYHEYIRGCSVQRGQTMSTSGGYHEYIGDVLT